MVLKMNASQVLEHIQINNIIIAAAGDGVVSGLSVSEKGAGANMSVDVATGSAIISGTTYTESSIVNLAIEAAHATLHRKDLITYDPTTSNPVVTKGTDHAGGTADPIYPPNIPAGDILLAIVEVAAAVTTITNSEIMDCIVQITKLDELGTPSDNTTLDATTAVHGLLKKLSNVSTEFLNGQGNWATPAGTGDMTKAVYDPNTDGIIASAQIGDLPASKITSGTMAVARGGTGVTSSGSVADVNATKVDGCSAGTTAGAVYKIPAIGTGQIFHTQTNAITMLSPGTNGYQLTTHAAGSAPTWAAASDLIFSDTHCPKCGEELKDGDNLILHLIGHNEVGDILTIPMHLSCANAPKKTVTLKRKVFEDRHTLDEMTGELKVQRVQKMAERTVTMHKLKEGYTIDGRTGKAHAVDDNGNMGEALPHHAAALEEIEETITEEVYEDVEYLL